MDRTVFFGLCAIASLVQAMPSGHVLHEKRHVPMRDALERRRIEPDALLPMRIGLVQNEVASTMAEEWLMAVSDPRSPDYGKHWSSDEVIEAFKPHDDSVRGVMDWLASHDIHDVTHTDNKQWLAFDLPAHRAEEIFKTEFFEHEREKGGSEASCDEYHLPHHLTAHIDFIMPGIKPRDVTGRSERSRQALRKRTSDDMTSKYTEKTYPMSKGEQKWINWSLEHPFSLEHCEKAVTPTCIRAAYNISLADPDKPVNSSNYMGLFETYDLYYQGDLDRVWTNLTHIPSGTAPHFNDIDGAHKPPSGLKSPDYHLVGAEADTDIQMSQPIIYPQNVTVYQTDDPYWALNSLVGPHDGRDWGFFNTFLDAIDGSYCNYTAYGETGNSWIDPIYPDPRPKGYKGKLQCGVYQPPYILSTSYSLQELDFPYNYQRRQCAEYLKLALRGTSIFVASGDQGVGPCYDVDDRKIFGTWQISGCPWITNVGASQIPPGGNITDPQIASDKDYHYGNGGFSSGGGFSLIFRRPDYQKKAVETYLAGPDAPTYPYFHDSDYNGTEGLYSRNGRAYPDFAALGVNVLVSHKDKWLLLGGTSASAPISAAMFNRIVEERLRTGKGPLGFLNHVLYQNPQLFDDVTVGASPSCHVEGFKTAEGWDAVTGLGTPNFEKLMDYFLSLP